MCHTTRSDKNWRQTLTFIMPVRSSATTIRYLWGRKPLGVNIIRGKFTAANMHYSTRNVPRARRAASGSTRLGTPTQVQMNIQSVMILE